MRAFVVAFAWTFIMCGAISLLSATFALADGDIVRAAPRAILAFFCILSGVLALIWPGWENHDR